jgi:hypothetical protein
MWRMNRGHSHRRRHPFPWRPSTRPPGLGRRRHWAYWRLDPL